MDVDRIWNHENQLHALIGLTKVEAEDIFKSFKEEFEARERQFKGPGERPKRLDTRGIFVMLLMYYRHYISMEALGALFNLNDSNVKRWSDDAQRMLKEVLKKKNYSHLIVPDHKKKSRKSLNDTEKSILMGVNNLFAGRPTK